MITAHRTGGSLVFCDQKGAHLGTIEMIDLGTLIATGSKIPIQSITGDIVTAQRLKDRAVVTIGDQTYTGPWYEFRSCALFIGSSMNLTGIEKKPISSPGAVKGPENKSPSVHESKAIPLSDYTDRQYIPIPPKRMKAKPTYIRQTYRQVSTGGV